MRNSYVDIFDHMIWCALIIFGIFNKKIRQEKEVNKNALTYTIIYVNIFLYLCRIIKLLLLSNEK